MDWLLRLRFLHVFRFFHDRNIVVGLNTLNLDVLFGFFVDLRFYPGCCLYVVIILEELIQWVKTLPHIVNAYSAVIVEIKAHPVVVYKHDYIRVSLLNVVEQMALSLSQNLQQQTHFRGRVVENQNYLVNYFWYLFDDCWIFYCLILLDVVDVGIC